jgi:cell division transport system ATP-binding protein
MKIKFEKVSKNYGSISALKNINFEIAKGEFVFLVGPSGAGKSTIVKILLNQIKPSTGRVLIDNTDLSLGKKYEIDAIRVKTGVIFQDFQLISDKTIEENIALNLDIASWPHIQIPAKIEEVLTLTGLKNRRHLFPSQLSGGELQRTALARALSNEPELIIADEPTGNLDIENSWNIIKLLKDVNEKKKTTIIMATHNLDVVNSLKRRIIYLKNGEIQKDTNLKVKKTKQK